MTMYSKVAKSDPSQTVTNFNVKLAWAFLIVIGGTQNQHKAGGLFKEPDFAALEGPCSVDK
jgi:hypothetical protein